MQQQSVDGNPYRRKEEELHSMLGVTTGENKKLNFIMQNAVYLELEISYLTWPEILSEISDSTSLWLLRWENLCFYITKGICYLSLCSICQIKI